MNELALKSWKKEIEDFIADGNLSQASKRLMDMSNDFQTDREYIKEALIIKSQYSKLHKENLNDTTSKDEINKRWNKLAHQMLDLLDNIVKSEQIKIKENISIEIQYEKKQDTKEIIENNIIINIEDKTTVNNIINERKIFFKAENVEKKYDKFGLSPISFELKTGEITCVVGENGSGKTTLLKIVGGVEKHDSGKISYPDIDAQGWYAIKQNIAYLPEANDGWQYGIDTFLKFISSVHGYNGQVNDERVKEIIYRLGIEDYKDHEYGDLSSGYQMRFDLAKALVWQPKILILDEPLAHLDVNAQQIFLRDLRDFVNSTNYQLTVLISSQHIYEIENISDNVIALEKGKIVFNDKIYEIKNSTKQNSFEVGCSINVEDLSKIMIEKDKSIKVYSVGIYKFIDANIEFTLRDLFQIFLEHKIEPYYIRDISNSTRKIFNY